MGIHQTREEDTYFEYTGRVHFDPIDITKKHVSQSEWKVVAMVNFRCDLDKYYAHLLTKRFGLNLNINLRGAHVTIINDKLFDKLAYETGKAKWDGKKVKVKVAIGPQSNGKHWWLRAHSLTLNEIRKDCGLPANPHMGFHLTLGHANPKFAEHSEYIYRQCLRYNL